MWPVVRLHLRVVRSCVRRFSTTSGNRVKRISLLLGSGQDVPDYEIGGCGLLASTHVEPDCCHLDFMALNCRQGLSIGLAASSASYW